MSLIAHRGVDQGLPDGLLPAAARSADATTFLAIYVALLYLLPAKLVLNGLPLSLSAASLVALGLGVFWLCAQMTTTLGAAKGRSPVRTMLFAYACALLASYAYASFGYLPSDERSIGDHAMVTVFAMIFLGLVACDGVRSRDRIYFLLRVIVGCATAVAIVGILQYLIGFDLTPYLRLPGMHFTATDPLVLARGGLRRVAGTTAHPIEFGVFCAMALPLAVHIASTVGRRGRHAAFWWMCAGLIATGLMFSVSRSAVLAAASAGIVLFCGWSGQRRHWMLVTGFGFLVFIKLISPGLLGTLLNLFRNAGTDDSVRYRTHDYATARQLISEHFFLGRGLGTWYAPKHEVFDNHYLLTLVDSGVIGLATVMGIVLAGLYAAGRVGLLYYRHPDVVGSAAADRDLALSLAATLAVVPPVYATFDFGSFAAVSSLMFLVAGIAGALLRIVQAEVAQEPIDVHAVR